jgi:hypothetical protein
MGAMPMINRWMAEISYRNGMRPEIVQFEELYELHKIIEHGPDWNDIEQIVITLNLPSRLPQADPATG